MILYIKRFLFFFTKFKQLVSLPVHMNSEEEV